MAKFFVSYSRSVKDEVQKVVDLLRASGHDVWWDDDIPIGRDWWATILDNIEWCEVFIFVTSEKSVESPYCIAELKYASDRNRTILPFMLDDPETLKLLQQLPARGQWMIYDGKPAHMLEQINEAYNNRGTERDIPAPRPPEPNKDGKSVPEQFHQAWDLAYAMQFDNAKVVLRDIRDLDYGEWGDECNRLLAQFNAYPN